MKVDQKIAVAKKKKNLMLNIKLIPLIKKIISIKI